MEAPESPTRRHRNVLLGNSLPQTPRTTRRFDPIKRESGSPTAAPAPRTPGAGGIFNGAGAVATPPQRARSFQEGWSEGWSEGQGREPEPPLCLPSAGADLSPHWSGIVIVEARAHTNKLKGLCSWLHQFEHARWLHAGLSPSDVPWPDYPYRIKEKERVNHLQQMRDYLANVGRQKGIFVRPFDQSLWYEVPECESLPELEAAFKRGTIHFSGKLSLGGVDHKDKLVFKLLPPSAGMGSALYRRFGSDRFLASLPSELPTMYPHAR